MKEFVRTLKEVIKMQWRDFVTCVSVSGIGAVIGVAIVLVVVNVSDSGEAYVNAGAIMAVFMGAIIFVIGGASSIPNDFNLAITMGKTRRYFVPSKYVLLALEAVVLLGFAALVNFLEGFLYRACFPGAIEELDVAGVLFQPLVVIGSVFGLPAVILLFSGLLMKFGMKFFWVIWALWMILCLGVPRVIKATIEYPESIPGKIGTAVAHFFTGLTALGGGILIAVIAVASMVGAMYVFRKQQVLA